MTYVGVLPSDEQAHVQSKCGIMVDACMLASGVVGLVAVRNLSIRKRG